MTIPFNAWVTRRILCDQPLNGELDLMSGPWKGIAAYLLGIPATDRQTALDGMLAITPRGDELFKAMLAVDPLGPAPVAAKRRSAHLGDLSTAMGLSRFIWLNWIVRAHFTLLSSNPKVGKTRFALWLAKLIWEACLWPDGQKPTFPAGTPTLWVAGDRHQEELRDLATEYGLPHEAIRLNALPQEPWGGWDLDNPDNVKLLRELIESERPGLVFIDTVWRATRRRLNREDEVNTIMTPIVTIAQECDVSIMGLMHLSKDMDTLGRRLEGLSRGIMKMFKPDPTQPNRRRLEVIGNFKEPPALGVTLRDGGCDFDSNPPSDPAPSRPGPAPQRLNECKEWLKGRLTPNPAQVQELRTESDKAGFSSGTLYRAKEELNAEEYVFERRKWWKLPVVQVVQDQQSDILDNLDKPL
jgi:hypothetical protein